MESSSLLLNIEEKSPEDFTIKFTSVYNTGKVYNNWKVTGDTSKCIYILECSTDEKDFKKIASTEGTPHNGTLLYGYIDNYPFEGTSYYRVRRIGFDGLETYSEVTSITTPDSFKADNNLIVNQDTEANGLIYVSLRGGEGFPKEILLVVQDKMGNSFYSKVVKLSDISNLVVIDPYNKIPPGIYTITGTNKNEIYSRTVEIKW